MKAYLHLRLWDAATALLPKLGDSPEARELQTVAAVLGRNTHVITSAENARAMMINLLPRLKETMYVSHYEGAGTCLITFQGESV